MAAEIPGPRFNAAHIDAIGELVNAELGRDAEVERFRAVERSGAGSRRLNEARADFERAQARYVRALAIFRVTPGPMAAAFQRGDRPGRGFFDSPVPSRTGVRAG